MLAGVGGTLALNGFFGGGAAIPEDTMTRGLAGYWSFDEGGGQTAFDASGNGNDGTLVNGPKWTQGKNGGALQFDGKDDYVDCGNGSSLNFGTGDFTAEYWIYYTGSAAVNREKTFLGKASASANNPGWYSGLTTYSGNGTNLKLLSSITNGAWGTGNLEHGAYFSPNTWQHVVLIRSGTTLKHYRNGSPDGQITKTGIGANVNNNLSFTIGAYSNGTVPVNGIIDEVRIYNRALTEAEVRYHYNHGGPVAQWDMDEGSGSVINDKSGNGNNGTISGATWVQGKHGTALSFDGVDDYVDCGNASILSAPKELTVGAWFRANTVAPDQQIVGKQNFHDEYRLILYSNSLKGQIYDANTEYTVSSDNGGITIAAGNWYHGEMTYDGQILKLYVNGVQVDSLNLDIDINPNSLNLNIGKNSEECYFFNGLIDEVRIYDYARTEEEIRLDYNAGLAAHLGPSGKLAARIGRL